MVPMLYAGSYESSSTAGCQYTVNISLSPGTSANVVVCGPGTERCGVAADI